VEQDASPQTQGRKNPPSTPNPDHRTRLQQQCRGRDKQVMKEKKVIAQSYEIPIVLNGKIENKNSKVQVSEVTYKNKVKERKSEEHKVVMIGDSFLRQIRENVDLSLSSKYSTYSIVKPGCELDSLLESANRTAEVLTQKDIIVICGGSNDHNSNKAKSVIHGIREFIEKHNHTNIILANVPIRYDLSYHSLINKRIRSYNTELLELTSEFTSEQGQVALIEIDFKRKYHTRHGLHFNKHGKLLFSNKIAQIINTVLGKRPEQKVETEDEQESHEQEKQEAANSGGEDKDGEGKGRYINGELVLTQAPPGEDEVSEGKLRQEIHGITSSNRVNMSEVDKCNQITNEVLEVPDIEDKVEIIDQAKLEVTNNNSDEKKKNVDLRTSGRIRKHPVTRGNDFLWEEDVRPQVLHL
jgi:hypothetical protein